MRLKAANFGQDFSTPSSVTRLPASSAGGRGTYKVQPEVVAQLFSSHIIPLTKQAEVEYLLKRLD